MEKQNLKPEPEKVKMYEVHSSKLCKIGWYFCKSTFQGVIVAEFPKGAMYMYYPLAKEVLNQFFKSPSKGSFFTEQIQKKQGVNFLKLGQPKLL